MSRFRPIPPSAYPVDFSVSKTKRGDIQHQRPMVRDEPVLPKQRSISPRKRKRTELDEPGPSFQDDAFVYLDQPQTRANVFIHF
jgi:hypothetical protein